MAIIDTLATAVKLAAAEQLSESIGKLQRDHGLSFDDAATALHNALHNAHTDDEFPGGGYIVIT